MTTTFQPRAGKGEAAARVRQIANQLMMDLGRVPLGSEVGKAYAAEGGNRGTAESLYGKGIKDELQRRLAEEETPAAGDDETAPWLTMTPDGRVLVPMRLRKAMRLDPSGTLQAEVVDGELRLRSPAVALEQARRIVRAHSKGRGSIVDELIAERRAEAARE